MEIRRGFPQNLLRLKTISTQYTNPRTRLQLESCFVDYINSKFLNYFISEEQICVDESIIKFKDQILLHLLPTIQRNQLNGVLEFTRWQIQTLAMFVVFCPIMKLSQRN